MATSPVRTKTNSAVDLFMGDYIVTPGGHTIIPAHRPPPVIPGSDAVQAMNADTSHPGIIPYPGRVFRLAHPQGAKVEAISTGDVNFSANPVTCYNPLLADSPSSAKGRSR
jgi:hypothetical protein